MWVETKNLMETQPNRTDQIGLNFNNSKAQFSLEIVKIYLIDLVFNFLIS